MSLKLGRVGRIVSFIAMTAVAGTMATAHDEAVDDSRHDNKHLLHDSPIGGGHVEPNTNYGFELIGWDPLGGISPGRYTDVWAHEGFAYVGTFQEPTCDRAGVYISDIRDPYNPTTVDMIPSPPNTRINDVKVHEFGRRDVLIMTLEPCGVLRPGNAGQKGQGGISLYDVTNPMRPHAIQQNFLDTPIHNTFSWTTSAGKSYTMAVDDVNINDVIIIDTTRPQRPREIAVTGIGDWILDTPDPQNVPAPVAEDGQLFMGTFAAPLLHDIWVENMGTEDDENWVAILSYWDAGFILLDVNDPRNPLFIADSTYPEPDPVLGLPRPEGNAHAAVFGDVTIADGGALPVIFGGDEDFDQYFTAVASGGIDYPATQGSATPLITPDTPVTGIPVYVGLACSAIDAAPASDGYIAVAQRGDCAFTTKAGNAEAAGYDAMIVFNSDALGNCEASVSMLVEGGIPALFVPRSSGFALLGAPYDGTDCDDGSTDSQLPAINTQGAEVTAGVFFDGWGYFHVLNATDEEVTVKYRNAGETRTVGELGEIGYYAPAELADPDFATGFGDLTMHNLETDPVDRDRSYISWYALGMRAVEFREGHYHEPMVMGDGVMGSTYSWNVHEVGRWIANVEAYGDAAEGYEPEALQGSNFWGVHVTQAGGQQVILGSDRNTGLHVFLWTCEGEQEDATLYCVK